MMNLVLRLPLAVIYERFLTRRGNQPAFVKQASLFEDVVVRCVRHAFANIPPKFGRVVLSRPVSQPFFRYRMLRHGYLTCPVHIREYADVRSHQAESIDCIHMC
jgi:hypothetical protein